MEILTGVIKNNKTTLILNIHNKSLAEEIKKRGGKIFIANYKEGILIKPGKEIHATIAKNKRVQIAITRLIKRSLIKREKIKEGKLKVYLNPKNWGIKELFKRCTYGEPISNKIPKNLINKNGAIRLNRNKYCIDISSKKLHDLAKKERIKCLFKREKDGLIIVRSDISTARRLTPHSKKRVQISIPRELIKESEKSKMQDKGWFPIKIKMNLKSFNLNLWDFYSVREENELVKFLTMNNLAIAVKDYKDPFDIRILNKGAVVEVHNSKPDKDDFRTRHKIKIGQVRLRVLEADHLIRNQKFNHFFIILNEEWKNNKYIRELSLIGGVKILYTNFKAEWYKKIGLAIKKVLS